MSRIHGIGNKGCDRKGFVDAAVTSVARQKLQEEVIYHVEIHRVREKTVNLKEPNYSETSLAKILCVCAQCLRCSSQRVVQ